MRPSGGTLVSSIRALHSFPERRRRVGLNIYNMGKKPYLTDPIAHIEDPIAHVEDIPVPRTKLASEPNWLIRLAGNLYKQLIRANK